MIRNLQKWIRYSGIRSTEVELRLYLCQRLRETRFPINKGKVTQNMYQRQLERIEKAISTLHDDLQYDYLRELEELSM